MIPSTTAAEIGNFARDQDPSCDVSIYQDGAPISTVVPVGDKIPAGALAWIKERATPPQNYDGAVLVAALDILVRADHQPNTSRSLIACKRPRLMFIWIVNEFFDHLINEGPIKIHPSVSIHDSAVIGAIGQGYEWDGKRYLQMPHLAGVQIESDVTIGPTATIMRGVLHPTRIGQGSRIGNGVNIGHGVTIGRHCLIIAHTTLGGSVQLGDHVTVYMGAMIANGVKVGDKAVIGIGAVVLKDVPSGETWVGNPARRLR